MLLLIKNAPPATDDALMVNCAGDAVLLITAGDTGAAVAGASTANAVVAASTEKVATAPVRAAVRILMSFLSAETIPTAACCLGAPIIRIDVWATSVGQQGSRF